MADLTPELLDKLEAIAKSATPGPWSNDKPPKDEDGWQLGVTIGATRGGMIFARPPSGQMPAADAKHIAAASPDVVLALVETAKELARLRETIASLIDGAETIVIESTGAPFTPKMVLASDLQGALDGRISC